MTRVVFVLVCALAVAVAGVGDARAAGPAPDPAMAQYEVNFMTVMSDHHQAEVDMARTCVDRAIHLELRALCRQIAEAQAGEVATMLTWLRDWYATSYEPRPEPDQQERTERMAALSSEDFEVEFMRWTIDHHRPSMVESDRCIDQAHNHELRDLCQGISERQSDDIDLMEEWVCDWYRKCS